MEQLEELLDVALIADSLEDFVERMGIEKGIEPDALHMQRQGALRMLMRLLQRRFESVPEAVQTYLSECNLEQLEELLDVALTVNSIDDFVNQLPVSDQL